MFRSGNGLTRSTSSGAGDLTSSRHSSTYEPDAHGVQEEGDAQGGGDTWMVLESSTCIDPSDFSFVQGSEILIIRTHWEHVSARAACANPACSKPFTSKLIRRDWCRRCGRIFCKDCVSYRRKLSPAAVPDPERGKLHRVCLSCYKDDAEQPLGAARTYTTEFAKQRAKFARNRAEDLDRRHHTVRQACVRLVQSYNSTSSLARSMAKLTGIAPEWSKVNFCPSSEAARVERCRKCSEKFTLLRPRHHCRLCGHIHCSDCLFSSLQVYPEEGASAKVDVLTPENLRKDATILQACSNCLDVLEDALALHLSRLASTSSTASELPAVESSEAFLAFVDSYPGIFATQSRAKEALKVYQKLIDAVGTGSESSVGGRGTVTSLAKHQIDLSDMFTRISTAISELKVQQSRCTRPVEVHIIKQVIRLCVMFYADHMFLFRSLKRDLSEILPEKSLLIIQKTMNGQVLNCSYMLIQQLAIECMAFRALETMAVTLIEVVDIIKDELIKFSDSDESYLKDLEDLDALTFDNGRRETYIAQYAHRPDWNAKVSSQVEKIFTQVTKEMKAKGTLKDIEKSTAAVERAWRECRRVLKAAEAREAEERKAMDKLLAADVPSDWIVVDKKT